MIPGPRPLRCRWGLGEATNKIQKGRRGESRDVSRAVGAVGLAGNRTDVSAVARAVAVSAFAPGALAVTRAIRHQDDKHCPFSLRGACSSHPGRAALAPAGRPRPL